MQWLSSLWPGIASASCTHPPCIKHASSLSLSLSVPALWYSNDQSVSYKHSAHTPTVTNDLWPQQDTTIPPVVKRIYGQCIAGQLPINNGAQCCAHSDTMTIITKPVSLLYAFDFSLQWLDYAPARNFMNYRGWLGVDLQDLWLDGMSYSPFVSVVLAHDLWPWLLCGLAKLKCRGDLFLAGLWNPWVFNPFPTHFLSFLLLFAFWL